MPLSGIPEQYSRRYGVTVWIREGAVPGGGRTALLQAHGLLFAIQEASAYTAGLRGIEMEMPARITCRYYRCNRECLKVGCPFFPRLA